MAAAISPAAMRRMITPGNRPTFLADEIDLVFTKKNQDDGMSLMQVLNSGYTASGYYIGCNGPMQTPTTWSTYCAVGIAGLKNLPQALEQRTILIPMRKREPGVRVEKFRETRIPRDELKEIISGIRSWVAMVEPTVMSKEASYPDGHDGRTEDIWEPLLIIADMAGREWPSRVRESLEWCSRVEKKETIGVELLRDIKAVFVGAFMSSQDLTDTLNRLEESRWSDPNDTPLSARGVARLLAPYGVKPNPPRKIDGRAQRGYYRGDFVSAWKTYLPDGAESNRTTPPLDPWAEVLDANMSDYH
ncbi:MAG: DUF3631 domain-containing protein [Propionibacteriaceae bacterium]|nr:DUF3631 domain-containing protein [Propionibacteriaceae bacterium]